MDNKKVLLAFAAGAVVGGLLGILFAPDKGSETREKVAENGKKFADAIKEKFNEKKESFCKTEGSPVSQN